MNSCRQIQWGTALLVRALIIVACTPSLGFSSGDNELAPKNIYTLRIDLFQHHLIESYQRSELAGGDCDEPIKQVIESMARSFHTTVDRDMPDELLRKATAQWRHCNCVLVDIACGIALEDLGNETQAIFLYNRALERVEKGEYLHPGPYAQIAARLVRLLDRWNMSEDQIEHYKTIAMEQYIALSQAIPLDVLHQRAFLSIIRSNYRISLTGDHGLQLFDRLARIGHLDACTIRTGLGMVESSLAWRARGSGYSHTVSPKAWDTFGHHMKNAAIHLRHAHSLDPSRPEAATRMIAVTAASRGSDPDSPREWFDRAVAAQFDWHSAYGTYLNYIQPRWGGSYREMINFARECLETERFDTRVPLYVIGVAQAAIQDAGGDHSIIQRLDLFPLLRDALEGMMAEPKNDKYRHYHQTLLLTSAWAAGHYDYAKPLLEDLPNTSSTQDAWKRLYAQRSTVIDDVRLFSSEFAEGIRKGDELLHQQDYVAAIDLYGSFEAPDDPQLQRLLRERLTLAQQAQQFETGEWVDLMFEESLPGWQVELSTWRGRGDHVIMNQGYYRAMLISKIKPGRMWEMHVDMEFRSRSVHANAAILFNVARNLDGPYAHIVNLAPNLNEMNIGFMRTGYMYDSYEIDPAGRTRFNVQVIRWGDEISVIVDDQSIYTGKLKYGDNYPPGNQIGLGSAAEWTTVPSRFRNVRIRKLSVKPPVFADD